MRRPVPNIRRCCICCSRSGDVSGISKPRNPDPEPGSDSLQNAGRSTRQRNDCIGEIVRDPAPTSASLQQKGGRLALAGKGPGLPFPGWRGREFTRLARRTLAGTSTRLSLDWLALYCGPDWRIELDPTRQNLKWAELSPIRLARGTVQLWFWFGPVVHREWGIADGWKSKAGTTNNIAGVAADPLCLLTAACRLRLTASASKIPAPASANKIKWRQDLLSRIILRI